MLKLVPKLMLVVGIGITGAACQDDGNAAPRGYYQPAASNPYNNSGYAPQYGYAQPAPSYGYAQSVPSYGYAQPAPSYGYAQSVPSYGYAQPVPSYGYANQQRYQGSYNQTDGRRYTSVTVTNRGQNGYRDDVVQQQVGCGSQYYDGYRTRTAPRC